MCVCIELYICEYTYIYIYSCLSTTLPLVYNSCAEKYWFKIFLLDINIHIYTHSTHMKIYIYVYSIHMYIHQQIQVWVFTHTIQPPIVCTYTYIFIYNSSVYIHIRVSFHLFVEIQLHTYINISSWRTTIYNERATYECIPWLCVLIT